MKQTTLPKPNSQVTEILYRLIQNKKGISERDTTFNMFRGHISNLRKVGLDIKHIDVPFVSKYGRKSRYRRHWLTNQEARKAMDIYVKMFSHAKIS